MRKEEEVEEPEDSKLEMVRLICNLFPSSFHFSFQFCRMIMDPILDFIVEKKNILLLIEREKKKRKKSIDQFQIRNGGPDGFL